MSGNPITVQLSSFNGFIKWEQTTRDTIDFKKIYVDIAEDLLAGLMLSEILYWYLPSKNGTPHKLRVEQEGFHWIAVRRCDWWYRTRINPRQSDRCLDILVEKGLIIKKVFKFNGDPTTHIRLNEGKFLEMFDRIKNIPPANPFAPITPPSNPTPDPVNSLSPNSDNGITNPGVPVTENTTRTPTETLDFLSSLELNKVISAAPNLAAAPLVLDKKPLDTETQNLEEKKETPPLLPSPGKSPSRTPKVKVKGEVVDETPQEPSELAKRIAATAGANRLTAPQLKAIQNPVMAFKAGKVLTCPSIEELYRTNPTFVQFVEYTLARLIQNVKPPHKPSRDIIIKTLTNFNRCESGWLDFERLHGLQVSRQTVGSIADPLDMFFN